MSIQQSIFLNAGYQIMNYAVPVFFMITGSLLLNPEKKITYKEITKKYILRIILALLVFGVPFAMLRIIMEQGIHDLRLIPLSLKAVLENNSLSHLWYLYALVGIYCTIPLLKSFTGNANPNEIRYLLLALIGFDFVVPLINTLSNAAIAFDIPLKYCLFYVLSGYYLSLKKDTLKKYRNILFLFVLFCVAAICFVNIYDQNPTAWTSYYSPTIALFAGAVFSLFSTMRIQLPNFVYKIDRLCFGVYLIHPVFIQFTYRFLKITPLHFELLPLATLCFAIIFIGLSFLSSWVLNLIKPLKKYVL